MFSSLAFHYDWNEMSRLAWIFNSLARTAAVISLGWSLSGCAFQDSLIFPASGSQGKTFAQVNDPPGCELLKLKSQTGETIAALYGEALPGSAPHGRDELTLIYFYGNGAYMAASLGEFNHFRRLGVNVIMPDYPGYGMSTGRPSEKTLYAAADAVYDYVAEIKHVPARRIVTVGWSLGAAAAIDLAYRRPVAGVAIFNAFTTLPDIAEKLLPVLPARKIAHYQFNNLEKIRSINCPIFICSGTRDGFIPPEMSDRLAAAAAGQVTRIKIAEAGHDNIFIADSNRVYSALWDFLYKLRLAADQ